MDNRIESRTRPRLLPLTHVVRHGARRLVERTIVKRVGYPTMGHLLRHDAPLHLTASSFVEGVAGRDGLARYRKELDALDTEWRERAETTADLPYPRHFDVEDESARTLYLLARAVRPEHVLETGVANGRSTWWILRALRRNGRGRLHSFDVRGDVGGYLSAEERDGWDLRLLRSRSRRSWSAALASLPPLDLFVHDSHHTYGWQWLEYTGALSRLRPGSVLASDDADASYAFSAFCERHTLQPHYLFDRRKVFAAARTPATPADAQTSDA
ncbi:class I SAM-dependent methyltransferase [Streptoalloteichus hindustanus]|uniref:Methyltransferase domain-containing protein n=1 Tax=Streptoalloteichus hindustanus TaxID=2017 RepID=A0A1M5NNR1_STRHI|nr:class I SAM-dependent methyltransferase [Streptoalloteichus hindustanus]SHG91127.1 Methyltransferase domain-containing protein [Streptoalloteichus hindustanus]